MAPRRKQGGWDYSRHTAAKIAERFPDDPSKREDKQRAYWARVVLHDQDAYLAARDDFYKSVQAVKSEGGLSVRDVAWILDISRGYAHNLVRDYGRERGV